MGKSQSTEFKNKGSTISHNPSGTTEDPNVQLRKHKAGKKSKDSRPSSYAGPTTVESAGDGIPVFNNRPSSTMDLSGRPSTTQKAVINPALEPVVEGLSPYNKSPAANTLSDNKSTVTQPSNVVPTSAGGQRTSTALPVTKILIRESTTQTEGKTTTYHHSDTDRASFGRVLEEVIYAYPKFSELRSIEADVFSPAHLVLLKEVCVQVLEDQKWMMQNKKDLERYGEQQAEMSELTEQCDAYRQTIEKREAEIAQLRETVTKLRSAQPDPGYTSGSDDMEDRTRTADLGHGLSPMLSDGSADLEDSARFKSRVKGGIYQATPLVLAEGDERSKIAVKRASSLKPVGQDSRSPTGSERAAAAKRDAAGAASGPPLAQDADVEEKLKWLEKSLEKERQENLYLRDRIKTDNAVGNESIYETLPKRNINLQDMVDRYRNLEEHAVGRLFGSTKQHLSNVSNKRRSQFICAVMETSYTTALSSVLQFTDNVHCLLTSPVKPLDSRSNSLQREANKPVKGHIRKFEDSQQDRLKGRVIYRSRDCGDVPDLLLKQMTSYLQKMSDVTDLSTLAENVVDSLTLNFSDCATVALLNQSMFSIFLHDCCRLAWQMAVQSPPLYISTESLRMDDRIHETLKQEEVTNAQVDYYLWPTLFDRRNGSVLYKGRVIIKTV